MYLKDRANVFDAVLVILSIVELAMVQYVTVDLSALVVLRGFRIFRVLKLAKNWKSL